MWFRSQNHHKKEVKKRNQDIRPEKPHLAHFDKAGQREVISVLKHFKFEMFWRYLFQCIGVIPKFKLKCTYVSYILTEFGEILLTVTARLSKRTLLQ